MEESSFSPFILVFNDIDATLPAGQVAEGAGAPRFAHLSGLSGVDDWTAAEAPVLLLLGHAPPARDAFELLQTLRARKPDWTAPAIVIASQPMARNARTRALGVREILPRTTATAEDLSCAIGNALACETSRRQANRDRAAQSLSGAEAERYRSLFENSAFGAAEFSCDGDRIIRVNQKFCAIGGYAPDELVGRQVVDFIPADELSRFIACRAAFLQGEQNAFARGTRILRNDGGVRSVRVTPKMVRDASGAPLYATAIIEDMTERIAAEAALRASEARYRAFFDNGAFGAFEGELSGRFTKVNQFFADLGGYAREEMIGRSVVEFIHPDDRGKAQEARSGFALGESDAVVQTRRFLRKDGTCA